MLMLCLFVVFSADELKGVVVFIGHGGRTPLQSYRDLEKRIVWEDGYGQQTPGGSKQSYLLGRLMRKLYIEDYPLLKKELNLTELLVRSAFHDRNLRSAQSFTLGLYPNGNSHLTREETKGSSWRPPFNTEFPEYVVSDLKDSVVPFDIPVVPILNFNASCEKLLDFTSCNRYNNEWRIFLNSS